MEMTKVVKFLMAAVLFVLTCVPSEVHSKVAYLCRNKFDRRATCLHSQKTNRYYCSYGWERNQHTEECDLIPEEQDSPQPFNCIYSYQCPSSELCWDFICYSDCMKLRAMDHAICSIENHEINYECVPGYEHPSYSGDYCYPIWGTECDEAYPCNSGKTCNAGKCINPCLEWTEVNTVCEVRNNTAIYTCRPGFEKLYGSYICVPVTAKKNEKTIA